MAQPVDRRTFLGTSAASLSAGALPSFAPSTPRTLILLWIPGGMAATETFDPKEYVPFQCGVETRRVLSTAPSISTAVPNVRIASGLENIARMLDRGTLIRSHVPGDLGALSHAQYQQRWMELSAAAGTPHITDNTDFARGCEEAVGLTGRGVASIRVPFAHTPFGGWDTHDDGHARTEVLKKAIDVPVASLILNLERRRLLERTVVVLASEFSRAPDVDRGTNVHCERDYGLHAHFGGSASVLLFGCGIPRGRVIGRTADIHPAVVVENPISFAEIRMRVLLALGRDSGTL